MKTPPSAKQPSVDIPLRSIPIRGGFWSDRQQLNIDSALPYQWQQLEKTGRIDNFRKAAGDIDGPHQGFFYDDSDVHKWAEAAFTAAVHFCPSPVRTLLDAYVDLMVRAQEDDGYLFTYNQLHFPGQRWINLQIEHELYTMGHFIEAGVAAHAHAGDSVLLKAVRKCADLIADVFFDASAMQTPGHQEIEIALIRLFGVTGENRYLEMARRFLERRGRTPFFGLHLVGQFASQVKRSRQIAQGQDRDTTDPQLGFDMSENLSGREPRFIHLRSNFQFLTGRYHQQHRPMRRMTEPVGHSVRWAYMQTAAAMLYRETGDLSLLKALEKSWDHMVRKKMYLTGGIGSLPVVEGFGRDFELDNEFAYAETCAAIAAVFWNWQMTLATGNAAYADLTEWQLYNAAAVGIGLNGKSYLYRNPLKSGGALTRKPWFGTACCPGNIARLWAQIGKYVASVDPQSLWIHQYIGCEGKIRIPGNQGVVEFKQDSGLPWHGKARLTVMMPERLEGFRLKLRIPGWAEHWRVRVNNEERARSNREDSPAPTAGGFSPRGAFYLEIDGFRQGETTVDLDLGLAATRHRPHPKVSGNAGKLAFSRGPLVYCLESIDNPSAGIPDAALDPAHPMEEKLDHGPLGKIVKLVSRDAAGRPLEFIPYYCWANRGPSRMQVWVSAKG